ncbi:MAG: hypothetical protein L6R35_006466, partial [Caloplaca aegaea]
MAFQLNIDSPINITNRFSTITGHSRHRVPNTNTVIDIAHSDNPVPYIGLRNVISSSLFEIDSIIEVAYDGVIPGPRHEYQKEIHWKHGYEAKDFSVKMIVKTDKPPKRSGAPKNLMTYGILRDALRVLWDFLIVAKGRSMVGEFRIKNEEKEIAALG